ncbi:translation elongation factor-like protein [archaeon]|jgi:U32 family peptidase|nr:translation elongation factor-like protein [archaeon]
MPEEKLIGKVFSYFKKIGVAAVEITNDGLIVGDKILIMGSITNFEQEIESMQVEGNDIEEISAGKSVGLKVTEDVQVGDFVYKLI